MKPTLNISLTVPMKRISCMLVSALEGGSNYWYDVKKHKKPKKADLYIEKDEKGHVSYLPTYISTPLSVGGSLTIVNTEEYEGENGETEWILNLDSIKKGLKLMAEKAPGHFGDMLNENDDATTGDVFLQMCLFGDVIFS